MCGDDWPLAVRYPAGSPAFHQHLTAGLLPPNADRSLPVHPVQLYEAAAVLVLWGLLWLVDPRLRRWGESFLLFGLGYCAIRFVCEWFRADSAPLGMGLDACPIHLPRRRKRIGDGLGAAKLAGPARPFRPFPKAEVGLKCPHTSFNG